MGFFGTFIFTFVFLAILKYLLLFIFNFFCPVIIVHERECHIIMFLGKIVCRYDEPGFHFLGNNIGWIKAMAYHFAGEDVVVSTKLDQYYLRSQPVNSEEGSPMGIGVWYEMMVSDPVKYRFENSDPEGSLKANVSNSTVRCLSNLTLSDMMENRHMMSDAVRKEVSPHSQEWGYKLGSVYVRDVHFNDRNMILQIEEKVVNRLRQVTAAILQDGENRVNVIRSDADRKASVEFAKAGAVRPQIVGDALTEISRDPEVAEALFDVLETERVIKSNAKLTLVPSGSSAKDFTASIIAADSVIHGGQVLRPASSAPKGNHPAQNANKGNSNAALEIANNKFKV